MSETPNNDARPNTNCIICLELADEALVLACCVDIICNQCYQKLPTKVCPKCRKKDFEVKQELAIRKFIREISPEIQFFVAPITGGNITLRLQELDTIDMIFQRIEQKTGVPIDQMRLTYNGKNLSPIKKSLRSLKIKSDCTIHQLGRLKGGK